MSDQYFAAVADAATNPKVRAVIVTGAGRAYCAGSDMSRLSAIVDGTPSEVDLSGARYLAPLQVGKPFIAAINGACAGIGILQALACDFRFASPNAKFTFAVSRRGLVAEEATSWLLPRLVGLGSALDLLLSGRTFGALEAKELGLVHAIYSANILDESIAYAQDVIANCSPTSMAIVKQQIYRHAGMAIGPSLRESRIWTHESFGRPDFREGIASFLEKRPPNFAELPAHFNEINVGLFDEAASE